MESINYLVRVNCMTFNHAPYIVDAMNGFTMQQTTFPFVCIIVDDASTDGEPEVISNYMRENFDLADKTIAIEEETDDYRLMFARHKSNQNCYFVVVLLKYNHYSINKPKHPYYMRWVGAKYIALCEGDDFWVRPYKLQKQIDFLESNPNYSMCFHNAVITYDDTPKAAAIFNSINEDKDILLEELIEAWINPTASIVFRASIYPLFSIKEKYYSGDWHLTLHCAVCGKVRAMKDVMSYYRLTYGTTSLTSVYSSKINEMYMQKAYILESLNEFTNCKYEKLLSKYIRRYRDRAEFDSLSIKKGRFIAILSMPLFSIRLCFRRLSIW